MKAQVLAPKGAGHTYLFTGGGYGGGKKYINFGFRNSLKKGGCGGEKKGIYTLRSAILLFLERNPEGQKYISP